MTTSVIMNVHKCTYWVSKCSYVIQYHLYYYYSFIKQSCSNLRFWFNFVQANAELYKLLFQQTLILMKEMVKHNPAVQEHLFTNFDLLLGLQHCREELADTLIEVWLLFLCSQRCNISTCHCQWGHGSGIKLYVLDWPNILDYIAFTWEFT